MEMPFFPRAEALRVDLKPMSFPRTTKQLFLLMDIFVGLSGFNVSSRNRMKSESTARDVAWH